MKKMEKSMRTLSVTRFGVAFAMGSALPYVGCAFVMYIPQGCDECKGSYEAAVRVMPL